MSDELFERIKQSNNTTADFNDASTSNTIMQAKLMVNIANKIRNNKEYKSMEKKDMEQEISEWLGTQTR
jgi:FAD synthase